MVNITAQRHLVPELYVYMPSCLERRKVYLLSTVSKCPTQNGTTCLQRNLTSHKTFKRSFISSGITTPRQWTFRHLKRMLARNVATRLLNEMASYSRRKEPLRKPQNFFYLNHFCKKVAGNKNIYIYIHTHTHTHTHI